MNTTIFILNTAMKCLTHWFCKFVFNFLAYTVPLFTLNQQNEWRLAAQLTDNFLRSSELILRIFIFVGQNLQQTLNVISESYLMGWLLSWIELFFITVITQSSSNFIIFYSQYESYESKSVVQKKSNITTIFWCCHLSLAVNKNTQSCVLLTISNTILNLYDDKYSLILQLGNFSITIHSYLLYIS